MPAKTIRSFSAADHFRLPLPFISVLQWGDLIPSEQPVISTLLDVPFRLKHYTLIGTFNRINVHKFPHVYPRIVIYVAITEVLGHFPLIVRIIDTDELRSPVECRCGDITSENPLEVAELTFAIDNIPFPQAGEYRVQVLAAEEMIGERRIFVGSE